MVASESIEDHSTQLPNVHQEEIQLAGMVDSRKGSTPGLRLPVKRTHSLQSTLKSQRCDLKQYHAQLASCAATPPKVHVCVCLFY